MELSALVRALDVLASPLDWAARDAWLAECLRRTREALGAQTQPAFPDTVAELEALLRLPGDQPGWLRPAVDSACADRSCRVLPTAEITTADLPVVSLRCALDAGLATLQRLHAWRLTLGQAFDDVDTGMAVLASDGLREVVRNARWDRLLREEPGRDRLREIIARQAARVAASAGEPGETDVEVDLPGGTYRLVVSRVAAGTLLPEAAVLVLLDRPGPELPTTQELRLTFGLRGREPQVALLAAEGLSNADIARRLRLSAHTVRHYLERVLERLGLHSRTALAMRLMAGSGERPQPPPGSDCGGGQSPRASGASSVVR